MAATITFHANVPNQAVSGDGTLIGHTGGSGLGFFGDLFGLSVPVGEYQTTTYVTDSLGTTSGIRVSNTKYASNTTVSYNGGGAINLVDMPNWYCPLNIRFSHDDPVKVQNCKLKIFDRQDPDSAATGVVTRVWESRHPHPEEGNDGTNRGQLSLRGEDRTDWETFTPDDDGLTLDLSASPGMSGMNSTEESSLTSTYGTGSNYLTTEGIEHASTRHDWFIALSASPNSIGSKTEYGMYFTLEYL